MINKTLQHTFLTLIHAPVPVDCFFVFVFFMLTFYAEKNHKPRDRIKDKLFGI
jgi:hypothetical protein